MTREEYKEQQKILYNKYTQDRKALAIKYAKMNNPVKIGDIIYSHIDSIKVDKITVSGIENPECVYSGPAYTKKGVPYKSGKRDYIYQQNLSGNKLE